MRPAIPKRGEKKIISSAKSMELKRMRELVCKSSNIREDMVVDLRNRILGGVYEVKAGKIADKILQHGLYILNPRRGRDCYLPDAPKHGNFH